MPRYSYIAKTKDSVRVKDVTLANSKSELVSRLKSRGLYIISIKELGEKTQKASFFSKSLSAPGRHTAVKLHDLTFLARNLATTLSSGVTLLRSLEIISFQAESIKLSKILRTCNEDIRKGLSFGEAIAKYPNVFSSLWQGIVQVGETSGNLPFVLDKLADYLELRMEFERKIKSALVYPSILIGAAGIAIFVFMKWILPKFTVIFDSFDVELPLFTKILFAISDFFVNNFLVVLIGMALFVAACFFIKKRDLFKNWWDRVCFKIPVLGPVMFTFFLERITSTIYILLDSGLPIVFALEVTANSVGNTFLKKAIVFVKERVRQGASLSDELRKINIFPLLVSEMSKIGEETGTMAEVFQRVSLHYRKDLTTRVERMIAAFEPLMIIFMGVIIGGIVISLFLPLFKISTIG
ncbi:MAG: type II secretion system F family protein [Omnitrophica bacterium]|nr:type II secretion system F family protein [Candidatus Omnitrophota bacterium]